MSIPATSRALELHHGVEGEIGHGDGNGGGDGVQIPAVHDAVLCGQLLDVAVHEAAAEDPLAGAALSGLLQLGEDLVHAVIVGAGEIQEGGGQGAAGVNGVHMGVVGAGQDQLAAGVNNLVSAQCKASISALVPRSMMKPPLVATAST